MKKLTSYLYNFEELIRGGFLYVDKTEFVWKLIENCSDGYFLSRPRRFGKSLLVSTLKAVFEGKRELFKGLALYDKPYDWKQYPVIHLDFGDCGVKTEADLREYLVGKLSLIADDFGININIKPRQLAGAFSRIIIELSKKCGQVVILIDEYDKPILENITNSEQLVAIRDTLADFYSPLKTQQAYERFVFLTGVSKFCHVSIFSKLNNLNDISMDERFATMLGYTQEEFETHFADHIAQTEASQALPHEQYLTKIKRWYDGFRFHAKAESVYNPVSLASFFLKGGEFNNYWFSTATPTYLINLVKEQNFDFEHALKEPTTSVSFAAYEVDNINVLILLLQTGYLTIHHTIRDEDDDTLYYLDFPNIEVKESFDTYLINAYTNVKEDRIQVKVKKMKSFIKQGNVDEFMKCFQSLLAEIPYSIHVKDEKYYQTVFFLIFLLLSVHITAESETNAGRIDAVVAYGDCVYIFEFKQNKNEEVAFDQIMDREYYKKYQYSGKKIILVGANFSYEKRQIDGWKTKQLP